MQLQEHYRREQWQGLILSGLMACMAVYYHFFYNFTLHPFEDAAMIMRYAQNMAAGHGIAWNGGEAPVDGATDFFFLVLTGALTRLGIPVELAVRLLVTLAHLLTIAVVWNTNLRRHSAPLAVAVVSVLLLMAGPAPKYIEAYFGTPVFALGAALTFSLAIRIREEGESTRLAILFAAAAFGTALIRPEGNFIAGAVWLALLLTRGFARVKKTTLIFLAAFAVLGTAYFLWRWSYFGHPLPNPYYIKGGFQLYIPTLREAINHLMFLGWPFLLICSTIVFSKYARSHVQDLIFYLLPLAAFTGCWLFISNAMNYQMRFIYAVFPVVLMCWYPLSRITPWNWRLFRHEKTFSFRWALIVLITSAALFLQHRRFASAPTMFPDGRVDIARALAPLQKEGYRMAVTEAGNLPYFSGWISTDLWGLNDARIAHHGGVTSHLLDSIQPELVMFHTNWNDKEPHKPIHKEWEVMVDTVRTWAEKNGYVLAGKFGITRWNTHDYYVRPGFPHAESIAQYIRNLRYPWYVNGDTVLNFAVKQ